MTEDDSLYMCIFKHVCKPSNGSEVYVFLSCELCFSFHILIILYKFGILFGLKCSSLYFGCV